MGRKIHGYRHSSFGRPSSILGDGGIIKTVTQAGEGWEQPKERDEVRIQYKVFHGKEEVAASSGEGVEFSIASGHLIPAFAKSVEHMKKGETSKLVIAPQ